MRVLVVVVAVLLAVAAAGCGGGGEAAAAASTDPLQLAQDAKEFASARADLVSYCAGDRPDPSVDAQGAATTLIRIARLHPHVEYVNGASYREVISYEAAHVCDPAIADQLESGLDSLP